MSSVINDTLLAIKSAFEAGVNIFNGGTANNSIATDEFRITNGVARYSANFARPIKQFPDHD